MEHTDMMRLVPLYSGSSGNASVLEAGQVRVLIDAGKGLKLLREALALVDIPPESIDAVLITHEHADHIAALGAWVRKYATPVYANAATWEAMEPKLGRVPEGCIRIFESERDFYLKGMNVLPFRTPHDAAESVGYRFSYAGRTVTFMTDIGHMTERLLSAAEGSDLLLLEANHDEEMLLAGDYRYDLKRRILSDRGHLSNENAGKTIAKLYPRGVRNVILAHLSENNNYEQLALTTVESVLRMEQIPEGAVQLTVAHRNRPTGIFEIAAK